MTKRVVVVGVVLGAAVAVVAAVMSWPMWYTLLVDVVACVPVALWLRLWQPWS